MPKLQKMATLILLIATLAACAAPTIDSNEALPTLEAIIDTWREQAEIPGVVVGISSADQPEILIASGESDTETHMPIATDGQFQIASISKTFIAAETLRLAQQGKLQLDDPIQAYLPEVPHGDLVTIRHLLNHRSGYYDPVFDDPEFIPNARAQLEKYWTTAEILELTFKHALFFEPGTAYRYSNTNYFLLGLIIEQLTGQTLGTVLTTDLFVPLGLEHTFFRTVETDITQTSLVHGYDQLLLATQAPVDLMRVPNTAILSLSNNNIVSSASDLLQWACVLYGKNSPVLNPDSQQQMLTFDELSEYGLGVYRSDSLIGVSYGHDGETAGYLAFMEYFPERDLVIVILANKSAASIQLKTLRDLILSTLYQDELENGIEQLLYDLKSDNAAVRKQAISTLGHSGSTSEEVVNELIALLKNDPVAENRKEAALALGLAGKAHPQTQAALTAALQDADASVREAVQLALNALK